MNESDRIYPGPRPVPSIGRVVHYVLPLTPDLRPNSVGEHRPALIIRVWGENDPDARVQLAVFLDGRNDMEGFTGDFLWATSILHDELSKAPGTWHWPEYVPNVLVPKHTEAGDGI